MLRLLRRAGRGSAPETIETDASKSYVAFEPIGVVLAVMPWNFPFWQVFRFAAPALMAGNAGVLKHASNVPACALAIEDVFAHGRISRGSLPHPPVGSRQVEPCIEDPLVRAATLTGATPAGSRRRTGRRGAEEDGARARRQRSLPVLADADLEAAVTLRASRLDQRGQSCIAAKRFIVDRGVAGEFKSASPRAMAQRRMGDPLAEGTDIGPQARHDLRDELHPQVKDSSRRARGCCSAASPAGPGAFYPATVLAGVAKGMPAYDEELFGPVAAILERGRRGRHPHRQRLAFGLGAAVFTQRRRERRAHRARARRRVLFVNTSCVRSASSVRRRQGVGLRAELGDYGIREFVNIKTVYVK